MNNTLERLKKLTSLYAVSGCENEITSYLTDVLADYGEVSVDDMQNVKCTFGSGKHFLLDAHCDEIGFIVKEITPDGFLKLDKCGGIDNRMLLGSEIIVIGRENITGVISTLPPHLQKNDDKKAPELDEIAVDLGMSYEQASAVVSLGDRAVFKRSFTELLGTQVSSGCLDNRAGVCAIMNTLDRLKNVNAKITVMFSSQEEVGTRGAKTGAFGDIYDEAIVVDVSFGYSPLCKKSDCGEMGNGAMIGISPILDKNAGDKMKSVAQKSNIAYQLEVMGGGHTGTNADVISISQTGIKTSLLSIPLKYMHSPVEVVDINDVDAVSDLIVGYIKESVGDCNA